MKTVEKVALPEGIRAEFCHLAGEKGASFVVWNDDFGIDFFVEYHSLDGFHIHADYLELADADDGTIDFGFYREDGTTAEKFSECNEEEIKYYFAILNTYNSIKPYLDKKLLEEQTKRFGSPQQNTQGGQQIKTFQELESMSLPELKKYNKELDEKMRSLHKGSEQWYSLIQHDLEVKSVISFKETDIIDQLGEFEVTEPAPFQPFSIYDKPKTLDIDYIEDTRGLFFVLHKPTGNSFLVDFSPESGFHVQAEALEFSVTPEGEFYDFLYHRSEDIMIDNLQELTEGEAFYLEAVESLFFQAIHYFKNEFYREQRKQAK
ncbi:hypothetical protein ABES80_12245 [Bacillus gobiensis]|uniref:hypothetical protein n=1 Tax=Bacillus gobiensis TaxID=1441095 RepID=UPI003D1A70D4